MAPRSIPRVEDFVSYADLGSTNGDRLETCIYHLLDKNRRCRIKPNGSDTRRAQSLREYIDQTQAISLGCLQQYALANCCSRHHQSKLQDYNLIEPLARKWQNEIQRLREEILQQASVGGGLLSSDRDLGRPTTATTTTTVQLPRYVLRSRVIADQSGSSTSVPSNDSIRSRFRPHEADPKHTVASKLLKPLTHRDDKSGILYLFKRMSTPGFVKIGLTKVSVQDRFRNIQRECGYTPHLVYSLNDVPHIYRVEMLVHYELVRNWRVEKRCDGCNRQHKEWFDVDTDTAVKAARQWCEWMAITDPYDSYGVLKPYWNSKVHQLQAEGTLVTAQVLLDMCATQKMATRGTMGAANSITAGKSIPRLNRSEAGSTTSHNEHVSDESRIDVIFQTIPNSSLQGEQLLLQAMEVVCRALWFIMSTQSRISTFASQPEQLERQGTGLSVMSLARQYVVVGDDSLPCLSLI